MVSVDRESHTHKISLSNEEWRESAERAATIMEAVKRVDLLLSQIESIVLVRKQSKSLIMWIPQYAIILEVVLARSAEAGQVSDKISDAFDRRSSTIGISSRAGE